MALPKTMQRVRVYNEGLTVFLFDDANAARIKKAAPNYWAHRGTQSKRDAELKALAADGTLVLYELPQDDELDVGVVVGKPLTEQELAGVKWRPPQTALLDLPSGKLFVDSANSLRAHPDEKPSEKGGTVKVPPGRYELTLHRVDWMADQEHDGPREILVLVPTEREKLADAPPLLDALPERAAPPKAEGGTVEGGAWKGKVIQAGVSKRGPTLALDVTEDQAEELGLLKGGQRLLVTVGDAEDTVFNQGSLRSAVFFKTFFGSEQVAALVRDPGLQAWCESSGIPAAEKVEGHEHWLRIAPFEGARQATSALFSAKVGAAATLRVGAPPFVEPIDLQAPRLKAGALNAVVLASSPAALIVHADYPAIRKLKVGSREWLAVELEGAKFAALNKTDVWPMQEQIQQTPEKNLSALQKAIDERDEKRGKVSAEALEPILERIDALRFGPGVLEARPLKYEFRQTWADPEKYALVLTPLVEPESRKARYEAPQARPGTPVILRKRG